MSVNVLYRTSAKATGGRDGTAATLDGALDVKLATPKELGGGGGAGNNPEQLFAAGYAACFIGAMKFVASQGGPKVPADASVTSTVGIGPRAAGGFGLDIQLDISLPRGSTRRGRDAGGEGAPGMPLFQCHPRQCRCSPDDCVTASLEHFPEKHALGLDPRVDTQKMRSNAEVFSLAWGTACRGYNER